MEKQTQEKIDAVFTIVADVQGGGKRVGQKLVIPLEYPSEIHTSKVTQRAGEWANGCIFIQEIISSD